MKSIFLKFLSFWLLFSGNLFASSEKILFYYDILKEMPKSDVVDKGKVCEKVAMLQIASEYSDEKFEIIDQPTANVTHLDETSVTNNITTK